ncbi:cytochrome c [Melioribacteraceae bacterium 4301-Me]|uniref:cytochrome c n=1 Tax=Pyranulibacter aquaticus TaxID=3163344 RepID=UPI003599C477
MYKEIFLFIILLLYTSLQAQSEGEKIFSKRCTACHTIGSGKLIGPDLANVNKRRSEEWIIKFVQSSQSVIKSGDSTAVAVFEANNKVVMPDQDLTPAQIKSIISYIAANSPDANNPNAKVPLQIFNASLITQADIERGKKLFMGEVRFANGGPACISCHNVNNVGMFNGGLLAKDLTNAFTRLSAAGIDGIIRNPPFPAMIDGFGQKSLTDQEIKDLLAFLYNADLQGTAQLSPLQSQLDLLIGVVLILNIVLVIFLFAWQRVKKYSVNLN